MPGVFGNKQQVGVFWFYFEEQKIPPFPLSVLFQSVALTPSPASGPWLGFPFHMLKLNFRKKEILWVPELGDPVIYQEKTRAPCAMKLHVLNNKEAAFGSLQFSFKSQDLQPDLAAGVGSGDCFHEFSLAPLL